MDGSAVRALTVRTEPWPDAPGDDGERGPLTAYLDPRKPLAFLRRGRGLVGIGEALRLEFEGPARIADAADAWRAVAAHAHVDDAVRVQGTGLVAFGSFAFADDSASKSVLVVPSIVIGRRDGVHWITWIGAEVASTAGARELQAPHPAPPGAEPGFVLGPGVLGPDGFRDAVRTALRRIRAGDIDKVVLARDLVGRLPENADLRLLLDELALGYPDTWTYAVDGTVGSSPETLVSVERGTVRARVLAGSSRRGESPAADQELATELTTSTKDIDEHGYAVRSVLSALKPFTPAIAASELPFALKLPNLWHLASDIEGTIAAEHTSLDLVAALHPTAAVAGTPRDAALRVISELEPFDRGRYAGPVGWVGGDGDGEWAIALRGAQIEDDGTVIAHAGAGIVADSDPERELAETTLKFRPMLDALS